MEDGSEIAINQRIKANPDCAKKIIQLGPKEKYQALFRYDPKSLYAIQESGNYMLFLSYYGGVSSINQKESGVNKPFESNRISFEGN